VSGIVVAIDGPAGAGKSTTARQVAEVLGYLYLDTGAMYRAVGYCVLSAGENPDDPAGASIIAREVDIAFEPASPQQRVLVNGEDVTEALRTPPVSDAASRIAAHPQVRSVLVARQKALGAGGGVVVEGRDTTTVVFPEAELKIFLEASVEARGTRRMDEMVARGEPAELGVVCDQIRERDERDRATQQRFGPWPPEDAIRVDTTGLTIEGQVDQVVILARERGA
jgi:cytidylate kinase